jgi:hypothetical protein
MTYKITKTDGSLLTEIVDGSVDQSATDLTLVGKNVSGYGEYINENFVKILENFASSSQPNNPILGQVWYDSGQNRLRVYDGSTFRTGSGPLVQGTPPTSLVQGDLWIDSKENQLYFYDGIDLTLAGPIYKYSQGVSGFETVTIFDTNSIERTIVKLWVGNTLLGIFSKDTTPFTPLTAINGFTGNIYPGFNQSTLSGMTFRVNSSSADALIDPLGNLKTTTSFVSTEAASAGGNTAMVATLSIQNEIPLILGPSSNFQMNVDSTSVQFLSNSNGQDYIFKTKVSAGRKNALIIKGVTNRIGIFNSEPQAMLHIGSQTEPSNVIIEGNLTINGTTTTVNSTELSVDDINITLADTESPSDVYANGGGLTIKGDTDKLFTWNSTKAASPYFMGTSGFNSSENINVASGSSYYIGGVELFTSATALASTITSAPGLSSLGTLSNLQVNNVNIQNNRVRVTNTNGNLELSANGLGNIALIGTPRITGMGQPVNPNDAANKTYVDNLVTNRPVFLSLDITGLSDNQIALVLNDVAPVAYFSAGTFARVHCTKQVVNYPSVTIVPTTNYITVDRNNIFGTPVLDLVSITNANIGAGTITVQRSIKVFVVGVGTWVYDPVQTSAAQSASTVPLVTGP